MSWVEWDQPQRDSEFKELSGQIYRMRNLRLRSAISYNDACQHGGDYWLLAPNGAQMFEADALDEIRRWLRLPIAKPSGNVATGEGREG